MFCAMRDSVWVRLRALCHCALSSVFLHIFPFPPFSCPSTPPPNPSFITFSTRTSLKTAGQNSQPPPGAPSSPLPSPLLASPLLSTAAPSLKSQRLAEQLIPSAPVLPPSQALPLPCASHVPAESLAKVPATGRAVYSLRVRSFLSTLTSFQNDSHRRLGDGRCSPQTICVPSFIPVLFAL